MVTSYFLILILITNHNVPSNDHAELSEKGLIGLVLIFGEVCILKGENVDQFIVIQVVQQDQKSFLVASPFELLEKSLWVVGLLVFVFECDWYVDAEFERMTEYLRYKVTVILKDLGDTCIGKDISKGLHICLLSNVLLVITQKGYVVVSYCSTDDLIIVLYQELRFIAFSFDVKFGIIPIFASLQGWTDDTKFHQELQIVKPQIRALEERDYLLRLVFFKHLAFLLEQAQIIGYPQAGQGKTFRGYEDNLLIFGVPLLTLQSIDHNLPMFYFICDFDLSLQAGKILLGGTHVKVPKGINLQPIILGLSNEYLNFLCNALGGDTGLAVFEPMLLIIIIESKCDITFVCEFLMGLIGRIGDRAWQKFPVGLVARIGEEVAELPGK